MTNDRYAGYRLNIMPDEITQTKRPVFTATTLGEAEQKANDYAEKHRCSVAVWLEEKLPQGWVCVESDVYVASCSAKKVIGV